MIAAHGAGHAATGGWGVTLPVVLAVVLLVALAGTYVLAARHRRHDGRGWSRWRTGSFLAGIGLLIVALVPQVSAFPPGSFAAHMYQHLLIGMYAPLALVLGAPVTLLLRSLPTRQGRRIGRVLGSVALGFLAHPVTALLLNLGGLYLLYFTGLYVLITEHQVLHHLVHLHFLAAGYLFAHAIAGPDPAPHRPSVPSRLVVLGIAIAGHAVLAQLLYAGTPVQVPAPGADLRAGADLMYYGGDIAELLLAFAMVSSWRPGRNAARRRRVAGATQITERQQ
ncbi:cytochrome c oxidase assembly protein [Arthrobacter echini]|uniref:Cytochrome c oxidase assembly protein n=1 Tax=Arthrobacter echini TaxID=1529066 RepID=A0A4S5E8N1_9MICC|nr:cytochrome c oxidase assembly protein [Arthrobacter echini]THJ67892.1 cytochrome c oxidase assembly protein [Arthrobacter echini]